ncbi:MAG: sterol desaturase family protein [Endozoicomonas sp.]
MDTIVFAIPVFFLLIVLEVIVTLIREKPFYRLNDAINSLSTGMLSVTTGIASKLVIAGVYTAIYSVTALLELSNSDPWVWVVAFVFYDFCYYWTHRMGHEINILWAAHAVHHQSEEYNLTTALRQTSTGFLFGWVFYIPMAVAGIPPLVYLTVGLINLLYQFWVHTRHIPKLGCYEWLFVTPSNHRVHHAKNRKYLDKNYGGVFIIWDRLFGTFVEEDDNYEPIRYGTLKPLRSWNPVWANLQLYRDMWQDARATKSWKDSLTLWFRKTGYRPKDVAEPMKMPDIHAYSNYDPEAPKGLNLYVAIQFLLQVFATTALVGVSHIMPMAFSVLGALVLGYNLIVLGWLLEKKESLLRLEGPRFGLTVAASALSLWLFESPAWLLHTCLVTAALSLIVMTQARLYEVRLVGQIRIENS